MMTLNHKCKSALHVKYNDGWKVFYNKVRQERIQRHRDTIELQKYYTGYMLGREKIMFEEELKDLQKAYDNSLKNVENNLSECLIPLLHYMEKFVELHNVRTEMKEKIENLKQKLEPESESGDHDNE